MKQPRFSIIVPVYNVEKYLPSALESVLQQTFQDWECICVDDGSKDSSGAILDEFAARDSRFVIVHKTNGGVSSARNQALELARGEFITSLDGDDLLHPKTLELCDNSLRKYPAVKLLLQGWREFPGEDFSNTFPELSPQDTETHLMDCSKTIPTKVWFHWYFVTQIWKREIIQHHRFDTTLSLGEDRLFFQTSLDDISEVLVLSAPLYAYRIHNASLSHSGFTPKKIMESFLAWQYTYDYQTKSPKTIPGICLRRLIRGAYLEPPLRLLQCPRNDDLRNAWKQYFDRIAIYPEHHLPARYRWRVALCSRTRSRFLAWLFFVLPLRISLSITTILHALHLR